FHVTGVQTCALPIFGSNPRIEAPVLNARIRKRWLNAGIPVGVIGPQAELTYPYDYLGAGPKSLQALIDGQVAFGETLRNAQRPRSEERRVGNEWRSV